MLRTDTCGRLSKNDVQKHVTLCGWVSRVRNLGALVFIDLRDRYGTVQLNVSPELFEKTEIKSEYCLQVKGLVVLRQDPNPQMATGEIEIDVKEIRVFSRSELPPFLIQDKTDALEDTRLKYRYLDLRRPYLQKVLEKRSKLVSSLRRYMEEEGFFEIETPTLAKSTPEGARDYLVPSRTKPGQFYALPQAPQIFKQLLMIGGIDRYYQVARCYRDEDLRADRQPEFTQFDVEMSFVEKEDVLKVIEGLVKRAFKDVRGIDIPDFKVLRFDECIQKYGSDKPDIRFGLELHDLDKIFKNSSFAPFSGKRIKGFAISKAATVTSRKMMDKDNLILSNYKLHSAFHLKMEKDGLTGSLVKNLQETEMADLIEEFKLQEGDLLILDYDENYERLSLGLGALRKEYGSRLELYAPNTYAPLFVIDWPLFGEEDGKIVSLANPFMRPRDEDLPYLDSDPTRVYSEAYDTVINGIEISSGALRIYDQDIQTKVFKLLGLSEEEIKDKFGFFIEALKYGTPPHGGFAIGIDRLAMIIAETDNIRDVTAFPKNLQAVCMMSGAPSSVPDEALDVLSIAIKKEKKGE